MDTRTIGLSTKPYYFLTSAGPIFATVLSQDKNLATVDFPVQFVTASQGQVGCMPLDPSGSSLQNTIINLDTCIVVAELANKLLEIYSEMVKKMKTAASGIILPTGPINEHIKLAN